MAVRRINDSQSEAALDGGGEPGAAPVRLAPLNVSGVMVTKKDLVEALRIYVPAIVDFQAFADGEHFCLVLGDQTPMG